MYSMQYQQETRTSRLTTSTHRLDCAAAREAILPLAEVACQMASLEYSRPPQPQDCLRNTRGPSVCNPQLQMLHALHKYLQPATDEATNQGRKRKRSLGSRGPKNEKGKEAEAEAEEEERRQEKKTKLDILLLPSSDDDSNGKQSGGEGDDSSEEASLSIDEDEEGEEEMEEGTVLMKDKGSKKPTSDSDSSSVQHRRRATPFQAAYLEYAFRINPRPDATAKYHISQHINMSTQRIGIWFQNKRARIKKGKTATVPYIVATGSIVDHSVPPVNHLGE